MTSSRFHTRSRQTDCSSERTQVITTALWAARTSAGGNSKNKCMKLLWNGAMGWLRFIASKMRRALSRVELPSREMSRREQQRVSSFQKPEQAHANVKTTWNKKNTRLTNLIYSMNLCCIFNIHVRVSKHRYTVSQSRDVTAKTWHLAGGSSANDAAK